MSNAIDEKISKIDQKKKELEVKKRILKEKERQKEYRKKINRITQVGKIADKANILHLDEDHLMGAFLQIQSMSNDQSKLNEWKATFQAYTKGANTPDDSPMSITFNEKLSKEIRNKMKSMNFKYNSFRNEFYGYSTNEKIIENLQGFDYSVDLIEE